MELFPKEKRKAFPRDGATVFDYATKDSSLSGAVAEIRGRYPANGFVVNRKIKELAYVLEGEGYLLFPDDHRPLAQGDLVLFQANELFAWAGQMDLLIVTAPRFDPAQYEEVS